jgi:predicted RNase H-like nuclease (RuvC/YqgF family)
VTQLKQLLDFMQAITRVDKGMPKIESKLINLFAGVLSSVDIPVKLSCLAHVNPLEANGEQTLYTLQYQEKLRQAMAADVQGEDRKVGPYLEHVEAIDRLRERAAKENDNLRQQLADFQAEEEQEFEELRRKLGLEFPVTQLLTAHSNSKESTYMTLHRDVSERSKNIQEINSSLKDKLKKAKLEQEGSTKGL